MSLFSQLQGRRRRPALIASLATMAMTVTLTAGVQNPAASVPADPSCPEAFPVADLVNGQHVSGLTVSSGTTPEEFEGEVLGVLPDGILPGMDLIMVRLTSAEIDRVGGVWYGMSGSPVYADDGTLIGAVAWGLSWGASPVIGLTPAAHLKALIDDDGGAAPRMPRKIDLPRRTAERLVAKGVLTGREADAGFTLLKTPVAVSGMTPGKRLRKAVKRLGLRDVMVYRSSAAPATREPVTDPAAAGIVPGGNIAASLSYGDFSYSGTGTVTMVCGEDVVAFGHPFDWSGDATLTMHGADALYVQEDALFGPFKVSAVGPPVGTIDQDRMAGIAGFAGGLPDTTEVTSQMTAGSRERTGSTYVSVADYLPDLAALGVVSNALRVLDATTGGTATTSFTIEGTTKDGTPFTLVRDNMTADRWDIGYMVPWELYEILWTLQGNRFTEVDIDSIDFAGAMEDGFRRYTLGRVDVKQGGEWIRAGRRTELFAKRGSTLKVRVTLDSFRDELPSRRVRLNVPVTWPRGSFGELALEGGLWAGRGSRPTSFPELVDGIENAPRGDQVVANLNRYDRNSAPAEVRSGAIGDVVSGYRSFDLYVG